MYFARILITIQYSFTYLGKKTCIYLEREKNKRAYIFLGALQSSSNVPIYVNCKFEIIDLSFASTETKFKNPITKTQNNFLVNTGFLVKLFQKKPK